MRHIIRETTSQSLVKWLPLLWFRLFRCNLPLVPVTLSHNQPVEWNMRPGASQSSTGNLGKWNTSTWMTLTTYHHVKNEYVWLILEAQSLLQQPFMLRLMDEILHQNPIKTVIFAISTGWPDIFHQQNSGFCTLVASQPAWQFSPHSSFHIQFQLFKGLAHHYTRWW